MIELILLLLINFIVIYLVFLASTFNYLGLVFVVQVDNQGNETERNHDDEDKGPNNETPVWTDCFSLRLYTDTG